MFRSCHRLHGKEQGTVRRSFADGAAAILGHRLCEIGASCEDLASSQLCGLGHHLCGLGCQLCGLYYQSAVRIEVPASCMDLSASCVHWVPARCGDWVPAIGTILPVNCEYRCASQLYGLECQLCALGCQPGVRTGFQHRDNIAISCEYRRVSQLCGPECQLCALGCQPGVRTRFQLQELNYQPVMQTWF